jgi:hypothetical protein
MRDLRAGIPDAEITIVLFGADTAAVAAQAPRSPA